MLQFPQTGLSEERFRTHAVLGDDIVIAASAVRDVNTSLLTRLDVGISVASHLQPCEGHVSLQGILI